MRYPEYYLDEGKFTRKDEITRKTCQTIEEIIHFVRSLPLRKLPEEEWRNYWRKRTAGQIIGDGFSTGCTDDGLVFATISRLISIPTAYVETIDLDFLTKEFNPFFQNDLSHGLIIQGHVFVDIYQNNEWIPYNPRYGRTTKNGKVYLWLPPGEYSEIGRKPYREYIEIGRGLDFSQLYTDEMSDTSIELRTTEQIMGLIEKGRKEI